MQKIIPCLWFDGKAEEAANFYVSMFKNSGIKNVSRYGEEGAAVSGKPKGTVMTVAFHLDGQEFMALNGGPQYTFSPATSFLVNCETQEEIDDLWDKLIEGGRDAQCGWITDKYGVTWQIVPTVLGEFLQSGAAGKSERVMKALLQMDKINIAALKQAYDQE